MTPEMTELEKALAGLPFDRRDMQVAAFQARVKELCFKLNHTHPSDGERAKIIDELVTGYNKYVFIEDGFHCSFGKNIHIQGTVFINFNCTFLDTNIITIGHCALIGPSCNIICTNHSVDGEERLKGIFNDRPVTMAKMYGWARA